MYSVNAWYSMHQKRKPLPKSSNSEPLKKCIESLKLNITKQQYSSRIPIQRTSHANDYKAYELTSPIHSSRQVFYI